MRGVFEVFGGVLGGGGLVLLVLAMMDASGHGIGSALALMVLGRVVAAASRMVDR